MNLTKDQLQKAPKYANENDWQWSRENDKRVYDYYRASPHRMTRFLGRADQAGCQKPNKTAQIHWIFPFIANRMTWMTWCYYPRGF